MFRKLLLAAILAIGFSAPALAQNTTCSDRPPSDSSNACANTRFVQKALPILPLGVPFGGTGQTSFTPNLPLIGNGTSPIAQGTRTGNTTVFATATGSFVNGNCVKFDSNSNLIDAGAPCSTGTTYDTVAALNAATVPSTVNSVTTLGYHSRGDGGGITYVRVASAPTLPCSQTSNSGASFWDLPDRSRINVKWCGAYGDGASGSPHDDTTAIINSINALNPYTTSPVGTVYFPYGTFNCSSTCIGLQDKWNIRFEGAGSPNSGNIHNASVLSYTAASGNLIFLDSTAGIYFEHLAFQFTNSSYSGTLIYPTHVNGITATDMTTFSDFRIGGYQTSGTSGQVILVQIGNTINFTMRNGFMSNGSYGILGATTSPAGQFANDVTLDGVWFNGTFTNMPVYIGGSLWSLQNCIFEPPTAVSGQARAIGVTAFGVNGLTISNSNFADATSAGGGTWVNFKDSFGYGPPGPVYGVTINNGTLFNGGLYAIDATNVVGLNLIGDIFASDTFPYINNASSAKRVIALGNLAENHAGTISTGPLFVSLPTDVASIIDNMDGNGVIYNALKVIKTTVAALPTCNAAYEGNIRTVTDANSTTYNATAAGGGTNHMPVYCNGTNWTLH